MKELTIQIPEEIGKVVTKHPEISWNQIISNTLWQYVKKMEFMDKLTAKSKLLNKDIEEISHTIKSSLGKRYK